MKSKLLRVFIIVILIFGSLLISNYYINYYRVDKTNLEIIYSLDKGLSTKEIINQYELDEIYENTKSLNISSDNIDKYINNNSQLKFFENTNELVINYYYDNSDDKLDFAINDEGIKNINSLESLKEVKFNIKVDDYYLKRAYSFNYTEEEENEFKKALTDELKTINENILTSFENNNIKTDIEIQIVEA